MVERDGSYPKSVTLYAGFPLSADTPTRTVGTVVELPPDPWPPNNFVFKSACSI